MKTNHIVLILPDIRSTYNVGSIFRTADAVGVENIYLVGYTPTPVDKFGRNRKDINKVSLGAELSIPWEYKKTLAPLISKLKKDGYEIVALEQDEKSIDYRKYNLPNPPASGGRENKIALIVGNEVNGLSKNVLKLADKIIEIEMKGEKESLNVSVATGVALFSFLK